MPELPDAFVAYHQQRLEADPVYQQIVADPRRYRTGNMLGSMEQMQDLARRGLIPSGYHIGMDGRLRSAGSLATPLLAAGAVAGGGIAAGGPLLGGTTVPGATSSVGLMPNVAGPTGLAGGIPGAGSSVGLMPNIAGSAGLAGGGSGAAGAVAGAAGGGIAGAVRRLAADGGIAGGMGLLGRGLRGGGGGIGGNGGMSPELQELLGLAMRRMKDQEPLFQSINAQALGGLPTAYQKG